MRSDVVPVASCVRRRTASVPFPPSTASIVLLRNMLFSVAVVADVADFLSGGAQLIEELLPFVVELLGKVCSPSLDLLLLRRALSLSCLLSAPGGAELGCHGTHSLLAGSRLVLQRVVHLGLGSAKLLSRGA